jgi:hypothetical protein
MRQLTSAETRVLSFLHDYPGFHTMLELDSIKLLDTGDALAVPELVKDGFLIHWRFKKSVAISAIGEVSGDIGQRSSRGQRAAGRRRGYMRAPSLHCGHLTRADGPFL